MLYDTSMLLKSGSENTVSSQPCNQEGEQPLFYSVFVVLENLTQL